MSLQKQGVNFNFNSGLDTKTDPNQVSMDKFLVLQNAVFQNGGGLSKRNGFGYLSTLPDTTNTTLTTYNSNLIAVGAGLNAYSPTTMTWLPQGNVKPVDLSVQALVRTTSSQTVADVCVASNGLVCTVYTENSASYYTIIDSNSNQVIVARTLLHSTAQMPRVVQYTNHFIITYMATISASPHIEYVAVPIFNPTVPKAAVSLTSTAKTITTGYDTVIANNTFFVAYNAGDLGGAIRLRQMDASFNVGAEKIFATAVGDLISLAYDSSTGYVWMAYYTSSSTSAKALAVNSLNTIVVAATTIYSTVTTNRITSIAKNGTAHIFYEEALNYTYVSVATNVINKVTINGAATVVGPSVMARSVGLASKPFTYSSTTYMLTTYGGALQPTYFLMDDSGHIIMRLAATNGGGFQANQILPNVSNIGNVYYTAYLFKDFLQSVNKNTSVSGNISPIYTQTGVNMATMDLNSTQLNAEIAGVLNLTGGQVWQYDGVLPVEQNFQVYPENIAATTSTTTGFLTPQVYNYQVCYEWTDGAGNLHRSAPSVPVSITVPAGTSTNIVTLKIPTLRLTYKVGANSVRIMIYRWSAAQQTYYQINPVPSATTNDTTVDNITYVDTLADSSILGNTLLYTTGGVVEDDAPPAAAGITLFRNRLWLLDAEDRNTLWYSKQIGPNTPVEMSAFFTLYVAPSSVAQGTTGPITAISSMDDKLIIFKRNAIYYVTGNGPDSTGANNDFSEATFITSVVGCTNPRSIVFMPEGIMFQSDKGIWLLGRNLSTKYIGAAVEAYNNSLVLSAVGVPGTNQVRFTLTNGVMLMYDYYYDQWGTFNNIRGITSCIYGNLHTLLNAQGLILRETPNLYLDNSSPVLLSFTSAWLKLANLQGYQRAYALYLLASYVSPHKLNVSIAYDYDNATTQLTTITPTNSNTTWGSDGLWGSSSPWGGSSASEQWRIFLQRQRCQAVQITITETFDASKGITAGAGFTMSGFNLLVGVKGTTPKLPAAQSTG